MHGAAEHGADEDPEEAGKIAELRGEDRADQGARARDGREVVAEDDPTIRLHEILAVGVGLRSAPRAAWSIVRTSRHQPRGMEAVGHREHARRRDHHPESAQRLAARPCEDGDAARARERPRRPTPAARVIRVKRGLDGAWGHPGDASGSLTTIGGIWRAAGKRAAALVGLRPRSDPRPFWAGRAAMPSHDPTDPIMPKTRDPARSRGAGALPPILLSGRVSRYLPACSHLPDEARAREPRAIPRALPSAARPPADRHPGPRAADGAPRQEERPGPPQARRRLPSFPGGARCVLHGPRRVAPRMERWLPRA